MNGRQRVMGHPWLVFLTSLACEDCIGCLKHEQTYSQSQHPLSAGNEVNNSRFYYLLIFCR